jgi:ATP-dependent Lon protease
MKESARTAISYVRSRASELNINEDFYKECDIHIHVPEGAIPKDGPSAGITLATAMVSALTGIPVKREVAMTGEITLRGHILPIGGLKEKSLAAHRAGVKTMLIPLDNVKDLSEIPANIKKDITFVPVDNMEMVLKLALVTYSVPRADGDDQILIAQKPMANELYNNTLRVKQ